MAERHRRRRGLTLLAAAFCLVCALFYPLNPLASGAERYAGKVAAASAVTYVSLRTLNAFLSTAQEAEVGLSVGASVSVQPLKTLEPIDDTVERIAGVVFALMVASGLLAVAMGPVSAVGFAMAGLGLLWAFAAPPARVARKLILYGTFFAIALPLCYGVSGPLADAMTKRTWDANQQIVREITEGIETAPAQPDDDRWFAELRDTGDAIASYSAMASRIVAEADRLIRSYIDLLAVLLFNLILLPLILIGGVFVLFRWLANDTPA